MTRAKLALTILVALAAISLAGCDRRAVDPTTVPEFVQQMMSVDFPADGQVHVQARGTFRVNSTTAICTFRPGWGLDWRQADEAFPNMRQQYRNGQAGLGDECIQGQPIFVLARPENNRLGSAYKIILAVWQGDAACVAGVERTDGVRPGVIVRVPDAPFVSGRIMDEHRQNDSIAGDVADLSRVCLAHFPQTGIEPHSTDAANLSGSRSAFHPLRTLRNPQFLR
jgi:hypothetical protein